MCFMVRWHDIQRLCKVQCNVQIIKHSYFKLLLIGVLLSLILSDGLLAFTNDYFLTVFITEAL